jgi:sugar (pentulose or hexulose) kinase
MDNVGATVGLKLWGDGDAYISAGTATNVGMLLHQPILDGKGLIYHYGFAGKWLVNGGVDCGGAGLRWFRDLLADVDFEQLIELASTTRSSEHPMLFLPYMLGQRAPLWNENATGVLLGLTPGTDRRHMVRMFMEGLALGARHVLEELCGRRPERAAMTGGVSHSAQWTQIFADATGIPLSLCSQPEVSTLGTAILAGIGVGLFADAPDAFARIPSGPELMPQAEQARYYDDLFVAFRHAYTNVLESLDELAALRKKYEVIK